MSDSCVIDTDAVRRFGDVVRYVFQEIDEGCGTALEAVGLIADLVPHSTAVSVWCESACTATDLVRLSADRFGRFAEHTDCAITAFVETDLAHRRLLAGLEARI